MLLRFALLLALGLALPAAAAFDQDHAAWAALLKKHVTWQAGGHESKVAYAGFKQDRAALNAYLAALSGVRDAQFRGWSKPPRCGAGPLSAVITETVVPPQAVT